MFSNRATQVVPVQISVPTQAFAASSDVLDLDAWLLHLGVVSLSKKQAPPVGLNRPYGSGTIHCPLHMRTTPEEPSIVALHSAQTARNYISYSNGEARKLPPPGFPVHFVR